MSGEGKDKNDHEALDDELVRAMTDETLCCVWKFDKEREEEDE